METKTVEQTMKELEDRVHLLMEELSVSIREVPICRASR